MGGTAIEARVIRTCESVLAQQKHVSAVDVLVGLGWLAPTHVDEWRQGRVSCLEGSVQAGLGKVSTAMGAFSGWARGRHLILGRDTSRHHHLRHSGQSGTCAVWTTPPRIDGYLPLCTASATLDNREEGRNDGRHGPNGGRRGPRTTRALAGACQR